MKRRKPILPQTVSVEQYRAMERATWDEKKFQAEVIRLAVSLGYRWYHSHDSRRSPEGFPDLVLVRTFSTSRPGCRGRCIFAELKAKRNKLTTHQRVWLECLRDAGAEAYEWRPEWWDDIEQVLSRDA